MHAQPWHEDLLKLRVALASDGGFKKLTMLRGVDKHRDGSAIGDGHREAGRQSMCPSD